MQKIIALPILQYEHTPDTGLPRSRHPESFFSTLKTERPSKKHYRTRDVLRADVFDYIERLYNARRRHSAIGYLSPVQFEDLKCA
jgi:transposase InsO family protein